MGIARRLRDQHRAWWKHQRELGVERWRKNPRQMWVRSRLGCAVLLTYAGVHLGVLVGVLLMQGVSSKASLLALPPDERFGKILLTVGVLVLLPAVWTAFILWVLRVHRQSRKRYRWFCHRCTTCDYDLSHTRDRCPECGHEREPTCPF